MRVITLLVVSLLAAAALGDRWAMPKPRVFASEHGSFGFKVVPGQEGRMWQGISFRMNSAGEEQIIWQRDLPSIPVRVFVSEQGHVVTVDSHGSAGYRNALVLYSHTGEMMADYRLEDFLTKEELDKVPKSISSRWWAPGFGYVFLQDSFVIPFEHGPPVVLSLLDGKISRK